jgi:hypothetical protein
VSSGTTRIETTDFVSGDELLLDRLSALVAEIDPVPDSVIAGARSAFTSTAEVSRPRRRAGLGGEPDFAGLAELVGPPRELGLLADRAAADMPGVAAEPPLGRPVNRLRRVPGRAMKADLHAG